MATSRNDYSTAIQHMMTRDLRAILDGESLDAGFAQEAFFGSTAVPSLRVRIDEDERPSSPF